MDGAICAKYGTVLAFACYAEALQIAWTVIPVKANNAKKYKNRRHPVKAGLGSIYLCFEK